MRIQPEHIPEIKQSVAELTGSNASVRVFGSRLDDRRHDGDLDLTATVPQAVENPTWLITQLAARISCQLGGRSVDVLLSAPNLSCFAIHDIADSFQTTRTQLDSRQRHCWIIRIALKNCSK